MDVYTGRLYYTIYAAGRFLGRLYLVLFVCIFAVPVDENGEKIVLSVDCVLLSRHKDVSPEDSDDPQDIGLSSEEEAEDLPEAPHIRRKYHQTPGPAPPTVPEPTSTSTDTATIQVPVAALEQVHAILGKIISGQSPQVSTSSGSAPTDQQTSGSPPFTVPTPKRGEKQCRLCFRKFWATETLKRHMKTHSGNQKYMCPNEGCGRKVASKRGLEVHMSTCQKEKRLFCKKKGCTKLFATQSGLDAHKKTHKVLSPKAGVCKGCGKEGFTRKKSLDDHYRTCSGNPDRVGPFPCPVRGCRRGSAKPFTRVRNLNMHLKAEHGHDPKHG